MPSQSLHNSPMPEVEYLVSRAAIASTAANSTSAFINGGSIDFPLVAAISKGNVTIQSDNILDSPIVSLNWMLESTDLEVAVAAFKRAREAWKVIEKEVSIGPEIVCIFRVAPVYCAGKREIGFRTDTVLSCSALGPRSKRHHRCGAQNLDKKQRSRSSS